MEEAGDDETPLQKKLEVVAMLIGKVGFVVAIAVFLALMIQWFVKYKGGDPSKINSGGPIQVTDVNPATIFCSFSALPLICQGSCPH